MKIAIMGGTGLLGHQVSEELRARGHEVRAVSRNAPKYRADLTTGTGLDEALDGCEVVVDASNNSSKTAAATLVEGTRRLLAAGQRAGVAHHVCVSIVGCDRIPMGYFQVKTEQEGVVAAQDAVPWTIVRATQFHEYLAAMLGAGARYGVLPAPRALVQPVASAEVARAVADVAVSKKGGRVEVAGPEVVGLRELAVTWRRAAASRAVLVPLPLPGALGRALRGGAATTAHPDVRGAVTFETWAGQAVTKRQRSKAATDGSPR